MNESEILSEISFCDWAHENKLCTYSSTGCSDCEISQAKLKALEALREKAEREKGCEYCNSRFGIATLYINEAGLQAGTRKSATYCPMCGRELKEEQT